MSRLTGIHNSAQERAAEGKPFQEPNGPLIQIAGIVLDVMTGGALDAHATMVKENSAAVAGARNGRKQRD